MKKISFKWRFSLRRFTRSIAVVALLITGLLISTQFQTATAGHRHTTTMASANFSSSDVIVRFNAGVSSQTQASILNAAGCKSGKGFTLVSGMMLAQITAGSSVNQVVNTLNANPNVAYAEPNYIVTANVTPNDPLYPDLWGLNNTGQTAGTPDADIDAPEAWDFQTGANIIIAVIDSGLDYNHEDIVGNVWINTGEIPNNGIDDDNNGFIDDDKGWDFANNDNDPFDDNRHGTHVAGIAAAVGNNAIGVTGVNWTARIMPLKFLNAAGSGTTANAISAIQYATMMGARVSNNSWGGGAFSQALFDAIAAAGNAGQVFVAAAGNDGVNTDITPSYPASYNLANVISVAASDDNDLLATFSNFGLNSVDLAAPGVNILSTTPPAAAPGEGRGEDDAPPPTTGASTYTSLSGTSMASPYVAGAVALVLSSTPNATVANIKRAILDNVDSLAVLAGITVSGGRLNIFNLFQGQGIVVTPNTAQVALGTTQQFTAGGGTPPYSWSTANTTIGNIDPATGLFTGLAQGITSVSATGTNGVVGTTGNIEVTIVVVSPTTATLSVGNTRQFTATGGTAPYAWSISNPAIASISATGFLTALAAGTATVTATDVNGASSTATVTINPPTGLTVTPAVATVPVAATQQFSVTGGTAPYTWAVSDPLIATINPAGLLTGVTAGTATITATDANGVTGTANVSVTVTTISVTPLTATVIIGNSQLFTATGGIAPYTWSIDNEDAGSIDPVSGLFTAAGDEPATVIITASDANAATGTATANVILAPPPAAPPRRRMRR